MWTGYSLVCEHIPMGEIPEAAELFSRFKLIFFGD
jgi:hypothetical protein